MSCNCKKELKEKLTERFKAAKPEAQEHTVELLGYGLGLTDTGLVVTGFMEAKATAIYPLKNGGFKQKSIMQNMIFSFCPFCGVKS
jgi:hypothetical protein